MNRPKPEIFLPQTNADLWFGRLGRTKICNRFAMGIPCAVVNLIGYWDPALPKALTVNSPAESSGTICLN